MSQEVFGTDGRLEHPASQAVELAAVIQPNFESLEIKAIELFEQGQYTAGIEVLTLIGLTAIQQRHGISWVDGVVEQAKHHMNNKWPKKASRKNNLRSNKKEPGCPSSLYQLLELFKSFCR